MSATETPSGKARRRRNCARNLARPRARPSSVLLDFDMFVCPAPSHRALCQSVGRQNKTLPGERTLRTGARPWGINHALQPYVTPVARKGAATGEGGALRGRLAGARTKAATDPGNGGTLLTKNELGGGRGDIHAKRTVPRNEGFWKLPYHTRRAAGRQP